MCVMPTTLHKRLSSLRAKDKTLKENQFLRGRRKSYLIWLSMPIWTLFNSVKAHGKGPKSGEKIQKMVIRCILCEVRKGKEKENGLFNITWKWRKKRPTLYLGDYKIKDWRLSVRNFSRWCVMHTRDYMVHCRLKLQSVTYLFLKCASSKKCKRWQKMDMHRITSQSFCHSS